MLSNLAPGFKDVVARLIFKKGTIPGTMANPLAIFFVVGEGTLAAIAFQEMQGGARSHEKGARKGL